LIIIMCYSNQGTCRDYLWLSAITTTPNLAEIHRAYKTSALATHHDKCKGGDDAKARELATAFAVCKAIASAVPVGARGGGGPAAAAANTKRENNGLPEGPDPMKQDLADIYAEAQQQFAQDHMQPLGLTTRAAASL
jgi:hypothetical protein